MTSGERETLGQMLDLLRDFRREVGERFDKVEVRLGSLEDERTARVAVDDALKVERRRASDAVRWRVGVILGAASGIGGLIVAALRG